MAPTKPSGRYGCQLCPDFTVKYLKTTEKSSKANMRTLQRHVNEQHPERAHEWGSLKLNFKKSTVFDNTPTQTFDGPSNIAPSPHIMEIDLPISGISPPYMTEQYTQATESVYASPSLHAPAPGVLFSECVAPQAIIFNPFIPSQTQTHTMAAIAYAQAPLQPQPTIAPDTTPPVVTTSILLARAITSDDKLWGCTKCPGLEFDRTKECKSKPSIEAHVKKHHPEYVGRHKELAEALGHLVRYTDGIVEVTYLDGRVEYRRRQRKSVKTRQQQQTTYDGVMQF